MLTTFVGGLIMANQHNDPEELYVIWDYIMNRGLVIRESLSKFNIKNTQLFSMMIACKIFHFMLFQSIPTKQTWSIGKTQVTFELPSSGSVYNRKFLIFR